MESRLESVVEEQCNGSCSDLSVSNSHLGIDMRVHRREQRKEIWASLIVIEEVFNKNECLERQDSLKYC